MSVRMRCECSTHVAEVRNQIAAVGETLCGAGILARRSQLGNTSYRIVFLNSRRRILPEGVRGTASTKRISRGCL
jgi:hypothetical protein